VNIGRIARIWCKRAQTAPTWCGLPKDRAVISRIQQVLVMALGTKVFL